MNSARMLTRLLLVAAFLAAAPLCARPLAFCSFKPLKDYALDELARCAASPRLVGGDAEFARIAGKLAPYLQRTHPTPTRLNRTHS